MSEKLKFILLELLSSAKGDTKSNPEEIYVKYEKIFNAIYTLIKEKPNSITIQQLIDRFDFKLFEIIRFTKACNCNTFKRYEATCDTSIVIDFSKPVTEVIQPISTTYKTKFYNSTKTEIASIPDKKDEIVKQFNEAISKISSDTFYDKFKDVKLANLKSSLVKVMESSVIRTVSDIKHYNFMTGTPVDIIDKALNRKA